ncbi:PAS domain S-box protein [Microbaculum marinum]|uniref:histidine kinase n=1 Tax=Microbaculum marinum TaxID=1764581 RepID=A0AAW9RB49_9HYPH
MSVALALTIAIFAVDTFTGLGIAVAVFYALVVMIAGRIMVRRQVIFVAATCVSLTIFSFLVQHGDVVGQPLFRAFASISAIAVATVLALENQSSELELRKRAELLDVSHDAIFTRDLEGTITYWNEGAAGLYGWASDEAVGQSSHRLLRTAFPLPREEITGLVLATGRWEGELVQTKRDGSRVHVASRWSLQRDERGAPAAILETNNDVTERRAAEERLLRAENELRTTIDTIPALVVSSWPDGKVDFVNGRWAEQGFSEEHLFGGSAEVVHPDDLRGILDLQRASFATGDPYEAEVRLRKADGTFRWHLVRAVTFRDETGKVLKRYATATDIEDRLRAEAALRQSEAYLAEAQRLSRTGSFGLKPGGGHIRWSDEMYRIFELEPGVEPTRDWIVSRTHPDDRALVTRLIEEISDDTNWDIEHRLAMPDGTVKYVKVVAHAVEDERGDKEFVGAVMDVTSTRHAEERLQRLQAELAHVTRVSTLGELTASIAHEVNQPLAAILTNGQVGLRWLDREEPDLDEVRAAVGDIVNGARRASDVIQRLRMLYRKSDPQMRPLDVNGVLDDTLALMRPILRSHDLSVREDLASSLPEVSGDPIQLQQVIVNLIVNGMDAIDGAGGSRREVVLRSRLDGAGEVVVEVEDSGSGIAPGEEERIFEAFFTTKPAGMGMGLSICRSIMEHHGGRLWVSGSGPDGTTMSIALPVGPPAGD